ncbi:MAG: hypothetical protein NTY67_01610 [Cyanobacteria bacterium]|nr:hypothetical protein [Cyanobacteriota bacterium]
MEFFERHRPEVSLPSFLVAQCAGSLFSLVDVSGKRIVQSIGGGGGLP